MTSAIIYSSGVFGERDIEEKLYIVHRLCIGQSAHMSRSGEFRKNGIRYDDNSGIAVTLCDGSCQRHILIHDLRKITEEQKGCSWYWRLRGSCPSRGLSKVYATESVKDVVSSSPMFRQYGVDKDDSALKQYCNGVTHVEYAHAHNDGCEVTLSAVACDRSCIPLQKRVTLRPVEESSFINFQERNRDLDDDYHQQGWFHGELCAWL